MNERLVVVPATVVIVDRNASWSQWATEILSLNGYRVRTSNTVEEALDSSEQRSFCLTVLCAEVAVSETEAIYRASENSRDLVRFIVVTTVRLPYSTLRVLWKAGAADIIAKPYSREKLLALVASGFKEGSRENPCARTTRPRYVRS